MLVNSISFDDQVIDQLSGRLPGRLRHTRKRHDDLDIPRSTGQIRNVYLRLRFVEGDGKVVSRMIPSVVLDFGPDIVIRTVSYHTDNFPLERNLAAR